MSQRDFEAFLWDIERSGRAIIEYTAGKTFEDYTSERMLRAAVEREFTIIGEALTHALKLRGDMVLPGARDAISFRNVLIHRYDQIDHEKVWRVIHTTLPLLLTEVRSLLGAAPA